MPPWPCPLPQGFSITGKDVYPMKTKKRISLILTAALALSACASAADSATTAAVDAATPESTAESASEPGTEAVETDTLYGLNYSYSQSVVYEDLPALDDEWNIAGTNVYKNDLNAGQTTLIYHCEEPCFVYPYVTSDAVYLLTNNSADNKVIALSPDGTLTHEIPFDTLTWNVVLYSDRYFYCVSDHAPYRTAVGLRLDLRTGETVPWNLPVETISVANAAGDFAVTERIVSDYPVPFPKDEEISDALLQNSLREYDLTDIATGKPVRKITEFPYKGTSEGAVFAAYAYLGKAGNDFYFRFEHAMSSEDRSVTTVFRVRSDGTQEDLGISSNLFVKALCQGGELRWLFSRDGSQGTVTVYDLQGAVLAQVTPPDGMQVYYPVSMLDDGRLLLVVGYDEAHDNRRRYAVMDADTFLNGSTEYTEMEFVG